MLSPSGIVQSTLLARATLRASARLENVAGGTSGEHDFTEVVLALVGKRFP